MTTSESNYLSNGFHQSMHQVKDMDNLLTQIVQLKEERVELVKRRTALEATEGRTSQVQQLAWRIEGISYQLRELQFVGDPTMLFLWA
jgi:hypothetical protein